MRVLKRARCRGLAVSLILCAGCAGVSPAQLGQTAGTIAGSVVAPGVGAPIGAVIGLLAGLVVQNQVDKVTEKHERKQLSDELGTGAKSTSAQDAASPSQGELTRVWVDESVQDGRLIVGHFDVRRVL